MPSKRTWAVVLYVVVGSWVALGSFFAARAVWNELRAEAVDPEPSSAVPLATPATEGGPHAPAPEIFAQEGGKPRFRGEIMGIYFSPDGTDIPEQYRATSEGCSGQPSEAVPENEAGVYSLKITPPPRYALTTSREVKNGVWRCGDTVGGAWDYDVITTDGYPGRVLIVRGPWPYVIVDVAEDRVKQTSIDGRDAVIVEPITPEGIQSQQLVIFPEPFGNTQIWGFDIPHAELVGIAQIVAQATKDKAP